MGRPLAKRYFGNVNTNDTGYNQDTYQRNGGAGIGGQGVASVTIGTAGTYTSGLPTATFSTPDLPGGVQATGVVHGNVVSAATTSNGSGYNFGDVLTVVGGTSTTAATFTVASTLVVSAVKSAGGTGYADGDLLTFSTGFSPSLILRVNRPGGGTGSPDNFTITQAGRRTSANPTNPVTYDSHTGSGSGCTVTLGFGVYSFSTVVVQGDYTAMPSNPASFTGGSGTGAAATVTFGVSGIVVTDPGSGYTSASDAGITFSGGSAAATSVMTTDDGKPYDPEAFPAIIAYGQTTSGGSNKIGDIVRQRGSYRYYFTTADGTAVCALKTSGAASAAGEMTINATDTNGGTYYISKLTAHKAVVVPNTGSLFAANTAVHWTFSSSDSTYDPTTSVVIDNA